MSEDPTSILIMFETLEEAEEYSKKKFAPMLVDLEAGHGSEPTG